MVSPASLFDYLLRLGDDSLILSQRISERCGHAPVIEVDLSMSNVALDLVGQATLLLAPLPTAIAGGRQGQHSEHLGHILSEMQFLPRAYPGAVW